MDVLELRGVCVRFGARTVLDGVDFRVQPGERVGLIGPNGSGKTTLLRTLAGILEPDEGQALPAAHLDRAALARRLAYLPQEEHWEFPFTVEEVAFCGRYVYGDEAGDRAAVERALAAVGLTELRGRPLRELSGGERRRALLARSLAQEAPALLLDEPTTALDLEHRHAVLRVLKSLRGSVVFCTHDLDAAAAGCDRLVVLDRGRVAADGPPPEVLTEALVRAVFHVEARVLHEDGRIHVVPEV